MDTIIKITEGLQTGCPVDNPFFNVFLAFVHFIPNALTLYLFFESARTNEMRFRLATAASLLNMVVNYAVIGVLRPKAKYPECAGGTDRETFSVESAAFIFTEMMLHRQLYNFPLRAITVFIGTIWFYGTWIASVALRFDTVEQTIVWAAIGTAVGAVSVALVTALYVPHRERLQKTWLWRVTHTRDTVYGRPLGPTPEEDDAERTKFDRAVAARVSQILAEGGGGAPPPPNPPAAEAVLESAPAAAPALEPGGGRGAPPPPPPLFAMPSQGEGE